MKKAALSFIKPNFDELSVLLLGISFFGLLPFDSDFRKLILETFIYWGRDDGTGVFMWIAVSLIGVITAADQCMKKGKSDSFVQDILLWSGVTLSLLIGINAASVSLESSHGFLIIFPLWNMFSALVPMWMLYLADSEDELHGDYDATFLQVIVGCWLVVTILYICSVLLQLHWSHAASIAAFYSETIDKFSRKLFK